MNYNLNSSPGWWNLGPIGIRNNKRRGFLVCNMYNLSTSKAIYAVLGLTFLRFQFFFSGLRTQPTNWPPVRYYDPNTPLPRSFFFNAGTPLFKSSYTSLDPTIVESICLQVNVTIATGRDLGCCLGLSRRWCVD